MKLTKAQEKILAHARDTIDTARALDYPEWLKETNSFFKHDTEYSRRCYLEAIEKEEGKAYWQKYRDGIALAHCNSKSLKKLEEAGLIEILYDSTGEYYGIDEIKVLNY